MARDYLVMPMTNTHGDLSNAASTVDTSRFVFRPTNLRMSSFSARIVSLGFSFRTFSAVSSSKSSSHGEPIAITELTPSYATTRSAVLDTAKGCGGRKRADENRKIIETSCTETAQHPKLTIL